MITILCSGSRGDVQPYIALAQALMDRGAPCRIAAGREYAAFIRGYGVACHAIEVDHASAGVDPEVIRQAQRADSVLKMFGSFRALREYGVHMVEQYHDACLGSDAIVFHPGLTIGHFMAERLGIPAVLASPFPLHATAERPSVVLYSKVKPNPVLNRLSYRVLQSMLWMASEGSLRPFWKRRYGRLPRGFGMPFERYGDGRWPAIVSCSDHVFGRPADWSPHVHQKGYWFVREQSEYRPDSGLEGFLARGDRPVYVGFGSMFNPDDTERVGRLVVEALTLADKRGVLGGMKGLRDLPETMLAVENVPHSWLFPRMAAVCHHGGAGTSAAGFRAGVPSVIVPFALDQHAWAHRAFELGVGPKPVPFKRLDAQTLAEAFRSAGRPETIERARELGEKIGAEDGAGACADILARLAGGSHGRD